MQSEGRMAPVLVFVAAGAMRRVAADGAAARGSAPRPFISS
jgi:hypothetical protein